MFGKKKKEKEKRVKRPSGVGYIFVATVAAVIGICFFSYGNKSLDTLALAIGIIVAVAGALFAAFTIADKHRGFVFGMKIVVAVAMLVAGIATIITRSYVIDILINLLGLIIIIDGSFKFNAAANARRRRTAVFWILLVCSVALITLGFLSIAYIKSVHILGVAMIIEAFINIVSAFYMPSVLQRAE